MASTLAAWECLLAGGGGRMTKTMSKHTGFAHDFYRSIAWQNCRSAYALSKAGLCERCLLAGLYSPGRQVHHKVRLTPENITDPAVALNWDNLELLCWECHKQEHEHKSIARRRRYSMDEDGALLIPPP